MSESKHTLGPWHVKQESVDKNWSIICTERGDIVANVNSETGPDIPPLVSVKMPNTANAEFIVRACNAHETLLEACKVAYNALGGNIGAYDPKYVNAETIECCRSWLSEAIAAAQPK